MSDELAQALVTVLGAEGTDLGALGRAWARLAPTVTLVPVFGLKATPATMRAALGLLLAASLAPAWSGPSPAAGPWVTELAREAARGVPLAIGAAVPIWTALAAGGAIEAVRGGGEGTSLPVFEGKAGPVAVLWGLLACLGFLTTGGPARVALAALDPVGADQVITAALSLAAGTQIAVAVAAPILAGAALIEVGLALVARAATPASLQPVLSLVKGALMLALVALFFDRMAALVLRMV